MQLYPSWRAIFNLQYYTDWWGKTTCSKKGKFPTLFEWLISSDIVENQNSLSAYLEQESQMDSILKNKALCFLPHFFLECLVWEDKQRCKLMYPMAKAGGAVFFAAVSVCGAVSAARRAQQSPAQHLWPLEDLPGPNRSTPRLGV